MPDLLFLPALSALIAAPGPTNALLMTAGATTRRLDLRLIMAVVAGYGVAVSAYGLVLGPVLLHKPALLTGIRLLALALMAWIAWKLWRMSPADQGRPVTIRFAWPVFLTTLANPKAIVVAFGILPAGWQMSLASATGHLSILLATVACISLGWLWLGARAVRQVEPRALNKSAALALWGLAGVLAIVTLMA